MKEFCFVVTATVRLHKFFKVDAFTVKEAREVLSELLLEEEPIIEDIRDGWEIPNIPKVEIDREY